MNRKFCFISISFIHFFTVTFDQFDASLMNKSIDFIYQKKKKLFF